MCISLVGKFSASALLLVIGTLAAAAATAVDLRPNIIFILADDLGYGDLGCYGQKKVQTPNIDKLAAEGMLFTQVYAGGAVGAPSRCALMTGLHTGHGRIRGNLPDRVPLTPEDLTLAEVLKTAGYKTCALGKWGLGDQGSTGVPRQQGFDEFFGYLTRSHAENYTPEYLWRNEGQVFFDNNRGGQAGTYVHDMFTDAAMNFARINRGDHQFPDRRFFIYLAYTMPHANNALHAKTGNGMKVPDDSPYSSEKWPQPEKNKAAMITHLDRDVGRITAQLKELKAEDNTVIFFTSDNGPHQEGGVDPKFFRSSGPLRGIKGDLYEGGIRVPMIVRWPGKVQAGATNNLPWAFWDVLPTLAELGGGKIPANLDGMSLVPELLGIDQKPHEFLYWESHEHGFQQALRMGDWKAVKPAPDKPLELYDLKTDGGEKQDVASKHPDVIALVTDYLQTARSESGLWPVDHSTK